MEDIGVDRLDHGIKVIENEQLVELVKSKELGLTCCPVSNNVVSPGYMAKEIRELLGKGVRCTINSDDPAYFGAYVNENLERLVETGYELREIVQLVRNSFIVSWLSEKKRSHFIQLMDEYVGKFGVTL